MKRTSLLLFVVLILFVGFACTEQQVLCLQGQVEECSCSDGTLGTRKCSNRGTLWSHCHCSSGGKEKVTTKERKPIRENEMLQIEEREGNEIGRVSETTISDEKASKAPKENRVVEVDTTISDAGDDKEVSSTDLFVDMNEVDLHQEPTPENTVGTDVQRELAGNAMCQQGDSIPCYTEPKGCKIQPDGSFLCQGVCATGSRTCEKGRWSSCKGEKVPTSEAKDGLDNDCDGKVDNVLVKLVTFARTTCGLSSLGNVRCWLMNRHTGTSKKDERIFVPIQKLSNVKQLVGGAAHSCALLLDGTVKCWGTNTQRQLGNNKSEDSIFPQTVQGLFDVQSISAFDFHTCALLKNGTVRCWGDNSYGQLGNGTKGRVFVPVEVKGLKGVRHISTQRGYSCALLNDDTVQCWGRNRHRLVEQSAHYSVSTPTEIKGVRSVSQLFLGINHACVLLKDSTVKCWGNNYYGQLGIKIPGNIRDITLGLHHTCALFQDKTVKCWGNNSDGQLGNNTRFESSQPVATHNLTDVMQLSSGVNHTCALLKDRSVRCWGENKHGEIGDGTKKNALAPVAVKGFSDIIQMSLGEFHTCVLFRDGRTDCVGKSSYSNMFLPSNVGGIQGAKQVVVGSNFTCALLIDGKVKCWGNNYYGQLGNATKQSSSKPIEVRWVKDVKQISAGTLHACALLTNGKVMCWGRNVHGELGNDRGANQQTPSNVSGLSDVVQISLGSYHSCALLKNGKVKCWGDNLLRQLGGSKERASRVPVEVKKVKDAKQISARYDHTCAVLKNGSATCWGSNFFGQLGNGLKRRETEPVNVKFSGAVKNKQITAGNRYTCVMMEDSSSWCWGDNRYGELGQHAASSSVPPRKTGVSAQAGQIFAGHGETCILSSQHGQLSCWGYHKFGVYRTMAFDTLWYYPPVKNLSHVLSLAPLRDHGCAVLFDRSVSCWGINESGKLGFISE